MTHLLPQDRRVLRLAVALGAGALWAAMLLGFLALVQKPLYQRQAWQRQRIEELETSLQDLAHVYTAHEQLTQTMEQLQSQIATIRRRVPADALEATFLSVATAIAEEEQLDIDNFRRIAITNFDEYSEAKVEISGAGHYAGICRFLDRVNSLERLSTVRQMSVETSRDNRAYPFDVVFALQFGMKTKASASAEGGVL